MTTATPLNAVIGNAGFYTRFGRAPEVFDPESVRIQTHFDYVIERLLNRDCSDLSPDLRRRRNHCINLLQNYRDAGVFPVNSYRRERTPVFIDAAGRLCAVGYLIAETAGRRASQDIADVYRLSLIHAIDLSIVDDWADAFGFERWELAMIQPTYSWGPGPTIVPAVESALGSMHWLTALGVFPVATAVVAVLFGLVRDQEWDRRVFMAAGAWGLLCLGVDAWDVQMAVSNADPSRFFTHEGQVATFAASALVGLGLVAVSWLGLNLEAWRGTARKTLVGFLIVTSLAGFASLTPWEVRACSNMTDEWTYDTNYGYLWQVVTPGSAVGNRQGHGAVAPRERVDGIGPALGCSAQRDRIPTIIF